MYSKEIGIDIKKKNNKKQLLLQGELERVYSKPEMNDHGQGFRLPPILKVLIVTKQKKVINQGISHIHWWGHCVGRLEQRREISLWVLGTSR